MSQTCPTCNNPVDPLRARSVGVRDGKVVAYCSAECARAAESRPTIVPAALATAAAKASDALVAPALAAKPAAKPSEPAPSVPSAAAPAKPASTPAPGATPAPAPAKVPAQAPAPVVAPASAPASAPAKLGAAAAPPAPVEVVDEVAAAPRGRRGLLIGALVVVGGAGAFLAYRFLLAPPSPATPSPGSGEVMPDKAAPPTPVVAPAPPPAPPPTADAAVASARATLVKNLGSESPRVQRLAAAALARTGDPQAIALLGAALGKETSDVSRLDLAYALARAGDKKGLDALVAGLGSARRDVRAQAGRQLALLGDARAVPVLGSYLDVSQLRLGAAEQLAFLADPAAIKALELVRADPKSTPDEKARATIALGIAGRADVAPELRALLGDARFNAFAASALAQLKDPAARPVLIEQLAVPSLRVEAARSLRRLEPAFPAGPHLPALLAALASNKDTEQVQVAEAILLLAGPLAWSERW